MKIEKYYWITRDRFGYDIWEIKPECEDSLWFCVDFPFLPYTYKNNKKLKDWCGLKITLPIGEKGICKIKKTAKFELVK